LLYIVYGFCLQPGRDVWLRYLRQQSHYLWGALLKSFVVFFGNYDLLALEQVVMPT
jgi:hypothetical protein